MLTWAKHRLLIIQGNVKGYLNELTFPKRKASSKTLRYRGITSYKRPIPNPGTIKLHDKAILPANYRVFKIFIYSIESFPSRKLSYQPGPVAMKSPIRLISPSRPFFTGVNAIPIVWPAHSHAFSEVIEQPLDSFTEYSRHETIFMPSSSRLVARSIMIELSKPANPSVPNTVDVLFGGFLLTACSV
jgi:hypothetical protein